jgi:hypothetical protein
MLSPRMMFRFLFAWLICFFARVVVWWIIKEAAAQHLNFRVLTAEWSSCVGILQQE